MCNGPLLGKILVFSVPLMLSGILQLLFNAVWKLLRQVICLDYRHNICSRVIYMSYDFCNSSLRISSTFAIVC
mgnify:CR=1 FL=1